MDCRDYSPYYSTSSRTISTPTRPAHSVQPPRSCAWVASPDPRPPQNTSLWNQRSLSKHNLIAETRLSNFRSSHDKARGVEGLITEGYRLVSEPATQIKGFVCKCCIPLSSQRVRPTLPSLPAVAAPCCGRTARSRSHRKRRSRWSSLTLLSIIYHNILYYTIINNCT